MARFTNISINRMENFIHNGDIMSMKAIVMYSENNEAAVLEYNELISSGEITIVDKQEDAEIILAIGGDGTLIRTIGSFTKSCNVPFGLIGKGTVNYLAMGENPKLTKIHRLRGILPSPNYKPYLLHNVDHLMPCINEFAITNTRQLTGETPAMLTLDMYIDDELVYSNFRGDGLIIATSIGSTGYAMSAGGPIVDIGAPVTVIVPSNEYSRRSRPLIVSNDRVIRVLAKSDVLITIDGNQCSRLAKNHEIVISKHDEIKLWHGNTLIREEKIR